MKPVDQVRFGGPDAPREEQGDCFRACVASVLELDLEDVPDFDQREGRWLPELIEFLASRGLAFLYFEVDQAAEPGDLRVWVTGGCTWIACGRSPRGIEHATVYRGHDLAHDPHPSRAGIDYITGGLVIIPTALAVEETPYLFPGLTDPREHEEQAS